MSLYRKYRPANFKDVIGQDDAIKYLTEIISKSKNGESIPHAYLISGSHGIGKTTIARIFAHELDTDANDLYELDAASTSRKIDDMRELIESVGPLPNYSKYKVYILDESHMLTQDSANAFLKTLEEPPAHVIFMLCTTNPEKIISTVRSRCTLINLKTPDTKDIVTNLNRIIKGEKIEKIDKEILEVVANHSNHSFRDSVVLLEKLIQNKEEITIELIKNLVGISNIEIVNKAIESLIKKDMESIIKLTQAANFDFSYSNFLNCIRDGILHRFKQKGKGTLSNELLNAIDKDVETAKFFTSANLLYFLEKEELWNRCKDKSSAMIAIAGNFLESVK